MKKTLIASAFGALVLGFAGSAQAADIACLITKTDSNGAFLGSVENFLGRADVSEDERRRFSSELHVEPSHPPVFLWTTSDDAVIPASHSQLFADACRRAHVPVAFTLFPHGPHALGLALDHPGDVGTWTTQLLAWLGQQWGPGAARPGSPLP